MRTKGMWMVAVGLAFLGLGRGELRALDSYGRLVAAEAVTRMFLAHETRPGLRYYVYGRFWDAPAAIVALEEQLVLDSVFWQAVPMSPRLLERMVGNMQQRLGSPPAGCRIMDPGGREVGLWYATTTSAAVRFPEPGRVTVLLTNVSPIEDMGGGDGGGAGG